MFNFTRKKRKYRRRKKQVKRFFSPFLLFTIIIFAIIIVSQKTAPETEIEYNVVEDQVEQQAEPEDSIIKNIIEQIKEEPVEVEVPADVNIKGKQATFSDFFSSLAWVDSQKTDLYFDRNSTNLTFPTDIRVNQIDARSIFSSFIPTSIASGGGEALITGRNRITRNNEIYLWHLSGSGLDSGLPVEYDWGKTGISNSAEIIQIYSLHNKGVGILGNWLVFLSSSSAEQTLTSINVVFLDKDAQIIGKKKLGDFSNNTQIKCGNQNCLMYDPLEMRFWQFHMGSQDLIPLPTLSNKTMAQSPNQVTFSHLVSRLGVNPPSKEGWMIGMAKDKQISLFKSTWGSSFQVDGVEEVFEKITEYDGVLSLFTKSDGNVFVLWSGYFAQAYEVSPDNSVKDLTGQFGWRISTGKDVKIFERGQFLYIINDNKSVVRFDGNINVGLNDKIGFEYSPSFLEMIFSNNQTNQEAFLISKVPGSGTKVYSLFDYGFDFNDAKQIASTKVNFNVNKINGARFDNLDFSANNSTINYFLSNNGGQTWIKTELGQKTKINTRGSDLRWKVAIIPSQEIDLNEPVYVRSIKLTYWYEK